MNQNNHDISLSNRDNLWGINTVIAKYRSPSIRRKEIVPDLVIGTIIGFIGGGLVSLAMSYREGLQFVIFMIIAVFLFWRIIAMDYWAKIKIFVKSFFTNKIKSGCPSCGYQNILYTKRFEFDCPSCNTNLRMWSDQEKWDNFWGRWEKTICPNCNEKLEYPGAFEYVCENCSEEIPISEPIDKKSAAAFHKVI